MSLPRGRNAYATISSSEGNEEDDDRPSNDQGGNHDPTETRSREPPLPALMVTSLAGRAAAATSRSYRRVAVVDDADAVPSSSSEADKSTKTSNEHNNTTAEEQDNEMVVDPLTAAVKAIENHITITVLDPAQAKFRVSVNPDWTISDFKQVGEAVHKVPPSSQRLIFRGKMLTDDKKLRDFGITEPDVIVHLFPKPKVVVASTNESENQQQTQQHAAQQAESGGAHIPRIVLDPREAEQRSSILVLGSEEVMEAQNNVKLFSFMLLIICSMELLALFTLMLGDPDGEGRPLYPHNRTKPSSAFGGDDAMDPYPYDGEQFEPRTWQNTDYIDLVISAVGFYVATLGIKASTENTLALARQYLIGTVIVGVAWNAFYFFLNVQAEEKISQERQDNVQPMGDLMTQAFFAILLPCAVWIMCCLRALQFHNLLQEAEQEATERIRAELDLEQGGGAAAPPGTNPTSSASANESSGLAMQNRSALLL